MKEPLFSHAGEPGETACFPLKGDSRYYIRL
jgi:hypothetical protein